MKCLIIAPTNLMLGTISGPQAWLYSDHVDKVHGIYSHELNSKLARKYQHFIVEINWFTQLQEFSLIVDYIKRYNPNSKILFGGLYGMLKYKEIFERLPVDYCIKGDSELPMKQFLDGVPPREIPNFVGRDFENEQSYRFSQKDFESLEFNLDWFPSFLKFYKNVFKRPIEKYYDVHYPIYAVPMVYTTKGGCLTPHAGCGYCLGARHEVTRNMYQRGILTLDNKTAIKQLRQISEKFDAATFFIMSKPDYDFRGEYFDMYGCLEFCSLSTPEDVANTMFSFKKAVAHVALYEEGLTGKTPRQDVDKFLELEDENHRIYFYSNIDDTDAAGIPENRRLYSEIVLPLHTDYKYYINYETAMAISSYFFENIMIRSFFLYEGFGNRMRARLRFIKSIMPRIFKFLRFKGDISTFFLKTMIPEVDKICLDSHEKVMKN